MSTLKTKVDLDSVLLFLQKEFDSQVSGIKFLKGGEMSQAFSFKSHDKGYVIRVNSVNYSFEKDKYASEHFASPSVPIPKTFSSGRFGENLFYTITEEAKGKNMDELTPQQRKEMLPTLISTLDAIHSVKIGDGKFGFWDKEGKAQFDSWKKFILEFKDDVYSNWESLSQKSFLEKDVVDKIFNKIIELSEFLPKERYLVHSDYGSSNVIYDGKKITGVLDWGESKYGDFLYDVAWLSFWSDEIDFTEIFRKHYREKELSTPHYDERILCYELYLGLGGIGFFAMSEQREPYEWAKKKLLRLLG